MKSTVSRVNGKRTMVWKAAIAQRIILYNPLLFLYVHFKMLKHVRRRDARNYTCIATDILDSNAKRWLRFVARFCGEDEVSGGDFDVIKIFFSFNSSQLIQIYFDTVLYRQMFQRSPFITGPLLRNHNSGASFKKGTSFLIHEIFLFMKLLSKATMGTRLSQKRN